MFKHILKLNEFFFYFRKLDITSLAIFLKIIRVNIRVGVQFVIFLGKFISKLFKQQLLL